MPCFDLRRPALVSLLTLAIVGLAARPAVAAQLDDRTRTTPTGWWYMANASEAQINAAGTQQNAHLVDLAVRSTNPWRFDAVLVQNSGPYALPAAGWFYNRTSTGLRQLLQNGNRMTDLEVTVVNNVPLYSGILVPNTGTHAREWDWIAAATTSQLDARLAQDWRLVSLTRFSVGNSGFWAGIIHRNRGAEFRATWWYPSLSDEEVGEKLDENDAQLIDLDRTPAGRWTAVMTACSCPNWGWFYNATSAGQLLDRVEHNGLRLVDARPYATSGGVRWAGVAVDNLDAASRRIATVMGGGSRKRAFYLKQVGGPVRVQLRPDLVHEPLSSVKVLIHLRAFQEIAAGYHSFDTQVDRITQVGNPPCWQYPGTTEDLDDALQLMMQNSDNSRTKAVLNLVGRLDVNAMVTRMGLTQTKIESMDCISRPPNRWTLREAGAVYESVANGSSLSPTWRPDFYRLMPGRGNFGGPVNAVIAAERPAGMSNADLQSFQNAWTMHYKAGSWDRGADQYFDAVRAVNVAGIIELPRCSGNTRTSRQYVFGMLAESDPGGSAYDDYNRTSGELFREAIRESLATWASCAP